MKEIFCAVILVAAMIMSGCLFGGTLIIKSTDMTIHLEGKDSDDGDAEGYIEVPDGVLAVEAKIERGQIEMEIGGRIHTLNKTQELSIDLTPGNYDVFFVTHDNFTGEVTLRALPKI